MGLFQFKKKKKQAAAVVRKNAEAPVVSIEKKRWSPLRKKVTTPLAIDSSASTPNILSTLSVIATDDVEIMTFASQRALMDQCEAIRQQLFDSNKSHEKVNDGNGEDDDEVGRAASEVLGENSKNFEVKDTALTYDRFSVPLATLSGSWDGSLLKITEEPVEYGTPKSSSVPGPVSVDISYTESELMSIITNPLTPPHGYETMDPSAQPRPSIHGSTAVSVDISLTKSELDFAMTPQNISAISTDTPKSNAAAVVSPDVSRSSIPMDELQVDTKVEMARNKGKSPLKGMPDDERMEYQKDEMAMSPVKKSISYFNGATSHYVDRDNSLSVPDKVTNAASSTDMDPAHLEIDQSKKQQTESVCHDEQISHLSQSYDDTTRSVSMPSQAVPEMARSIMNAAFKCGIEARDATLKTRNNCLKGFAASEGVTDMAEPVQEIQNQNKRPVYLDEASIVRFLRRFTLHGFALLYLQPAYESSNVPVDDWKGRTVTMLINKGGYAKSEGVSETMAQSPRLEWTTVTGGQAIVATTTCLNLLDILSVLTNDDTMEDEADMCFFTITSANGAVHIFEAATLDERDRIVNGLKTVIARWSFHLIAGDITATSELYNNHSLADSRQEENDMPPLPNPSQTMNRLAHMLLDC